MSAGTTLYSFLYPRRVVFGEVALPPSSSIRQHAVRIGVIVAALAIMAFFFLPTIIPGQRILPGDWTPLSTSFLTDILYGTLALAMIAALPLVNPKRARNLLIEPGGFAGFAVRYATFGILWTGIALGLEAAQGGGLSSLTDTQRLQNLVNFTFFVGVAEELLFRCALSEYFGGIWSTIAFAGYHAFAYSVTAGVGWGLLIAMGTAGLYGAIFLWEYKAFGLSAAMASHTALDLGSSGTIGLATTHATPFVLAFLP